MKTKPIGIRFEQDEREKIVRYAEAHGMSFSDVIRRGVLEFIEPDCRKELSSLAEIAKRCDESDISLLFSQFLDDFARADDKSALIEEEPVWQCDPGRWRYDFAATAHKLAHDNTLPVPMWALKEEYIAKQPYYAFDTENPEFQEYLRETTPREFASHNLYLGESILKRA